MINIGITGANGFIGSHLYNTILLQPDTFKVIPFEKAYFLNEEKLVQWVQQCDVIVHLAALNRHSDPQEIYQMNVGLVQKLVAALTKAQSKAHVLFSSSTQEDRNNTYGQSKKEGRALLKQWAQQSGGKATGLIIPNVFGPFGKPFYNSVVATFCHQLCHNQSPNIDIDASVKLIFIAELVQQIVDICLQKTNSTPEQIIKPTAEIKVSDLLATLVTFKECYLDQGILPKLNHTFELQLFNTFRSYINLEQHFPVKYIQHTDNRGSFVELARLFQNGQVSFSTTHSGITRGNHFHTRKVERFAVIKGKAKIQLRKFNTEKVYEFEMDGDVQPAYVDMPIWFTHNITNVGTEDLYTVFWINEPYDAADPDTFMEVV